MEGQTHFKVAAGLPLADDDKVAASEWANEARRMRLPHLRALAQQWQSTVSTLTGLFGAATVLNADEAVRALTPGSRDLYGVVVVMSLVCAGGAITLASLAGQPSRERIPADVEGQYRVYSQIFDRASARLACSRWLALPAVVLLILSIGVRWYAPRAPTTVAPTKAASISYIDLNHQRNSGVSPAKIPTPDDSFRTG